MTVDAAGNLPARLDALEARGRSHLLARRRRAAAERASILAMRATVAVPLLALLLSFVRPVPVLPLVVVAASIPLLAFCIAHGLGRAGVVVDRAAALAQFDRQPGAKDRVAVTDQFLHEPVTDGFRGAALADAEPWLAGALAAPLTRTDGSPPGWRRGWPFALAALLLLTLAVIWRAGPPRPVAGGGVATPGATALRAGPVEGATQPPADMLALAAAALRERLGLAPTAHGIGVGGDRGGAGIADVAAASGGAAGASSPGRQGDPGAGEAIAGSAASKSGMGQGAAGAAGGAGAGAAGLDGAEAGAAGGGGTGMADAGDPPGATPPSTSLLRSVAGADGRPAVDPAGGATPPRRNGGRAARSSPMPANGPAGANPPDPRDGSAQAPQNNSGARRPTPPDGNEAGQGQEQAQGPSKSGTGQNGQSNGQDAVKRSRGTSSLILAVPTQDRLAGTLGRGASQTMTRRVPPRPDDAEAVAAGARADRQGSAGRVPDRATSVHEDRLVQRYFARRPGGARER